MDDSRCIYMVGMNIPQTTPPELKAFNNFYSHTHVPEVVGNNPGFLTGTRYELLDPTLNGPRFLAVYEVADEQLAKAHLARTPRAGGPKYSAGPDIWQQHDTLWRLMYTRIGETHHR
ncbi:MAG: hypothetical protein ACRDGF_08160 [Chloroflexota bacterium]